MALNVIDFSQGIRPEEIQENFEYLQEQIKKERISVGGPGISSGLEIETVVNEVDFYIKVSPGIVIDNDGNELYIEGATLNIEPPELFQYKENVDVSNDRTITLRHKPYSLNRRLPVEYSNSFDPEDSGIEIQDPGIPGDSFIRVRGIVDRTLSIAGALSRNLNVTYYYTAKRIDTIYIDNDYKIRINKGTTDSSPSPFKMMPSDFKLLIAYLEIDCYFKDANNSVEHAYMYIKDDLRSIRNVYTAQDGCLYLCGIPFDDLQIIHLREPKHPKENCLWLNSIDNTLYCWRSVDSFTYKDVIDITTDFRVESDADLLFETSIEYYIGEGELTVYLNNVKLIIGRDYEEVELEKDTKNDTDKIKSKAFRILQTLERISEFEDKIIPGDRIIYTIKYKDSHFMWLPVNRMNYVTSKNTKVFSTYYEGMEEKYFYEIDPETDNRLAYFDSRLANKLGVNKETGYPNKYQYFFFDRFEDLNMLYTPGAKELSVMVNQMFLHEDQFKEITVYDLLNGDLPEEVTTAVMSNFNWNWDYISNHFNGDYDNSGIGFMLTEPLDAGLNAESYDHRYYDGSNDLFVEAIVERRICATPTVRKLERSATFMFEDFVYINVDGNFIIELPDGIQYRFNERQLELFADGKKLTEGIDYIEEYGFYKENVEIFGDDSIDNTMIIGPIENTNETIDKSYFLRKKSALCNKIKLIKNFDMGTIVNYKITTNIYSYDHVNNIFDDLGDTLISYRETITNFVTDLNVFKDNVNNRVEEAERQVQQLSNDKEDYMTSNSVVEIGQLPNVIVKNAIKSLNHINQSVELIEDKLTYSLNDIFEDDYINIFYHNSRTNNDNYWLRDLHYKITDLDSSTSYLEILTEDNFGTGDKLYISGLKLAFNSNRPL